MSGTFDYHNASLAGDPRWSSASRWTGKAPVVVLTIFALAIINTVLGAVWVASYSSNMTVPKIIQTLILPGLAFFNAVPSLHLHCLARRNPPGLALSFSSIFVLLFVSSWMLSVVSCNLPAAAAPLGLRQVECARGVAGVDHGPALALWWVFMVLELLLAALYAAHAAMAWYVRGVENRRARTDKENGYVTMSSLEDQQKARERWRELVSTGHVL